MLKKKMEKGQINLMADFDDVGLDEDEDEIAEVNSRGKRVLSSEVNSSSKKARQVGPIDAFLAPKIATQTGKGGKGKQTTINDAYKKELREKACTDIARWMYEAAIPFNVVNHDSFKVAIESIGRYGVGMRPPSYHEVRVPLLKKEVTRTDNIMRGHREEWARTGCSIMSDGWQDRSHRSLINFLVNSSKGSMFIESVDASSYIKTGERMFQLLDKMVEKIGEGNIVQVITDNASNYVMAGKKRTLLI